MYALLHAASVLVDLLGLLVIVRILLTWFPQISSRHPAVQLLDRVVQPVLRPFRHVLPTFTGIDFSPLLAILVIHEIARMLDYASNYVLFSPVTAVEEVIIQLVLDIIGYVCLIVLARLIVALFHADPWHPLVNVIRQLSAPLLRPFGGLGLRTKNDETQAAVAFGVYAALYVVVRFVTDSRLLF